MANIERHLSLGQLLLMHEVFLSSEQLQSSLDVFARRSVEELLKEHRPRASKTRARGIDARIVSIVGLARRIRTYSRYEGLGNCRPVPSDPSEQNQEANQEDGAQELCDVISCTLSCFVS